jgi:hypothetical protein
MQRGKPKLTALWHALDEAAFGSERTLNLRELLPSAAEARARTETWLRGRQVTKPEEVLIITGRGNQSSGGIGVVRKEILAMMPGLRRRGIVESWREHSPGSLIVKLAPTSALFAAPKRRRGTIPEAAKTEDTSLSGLEPETTAMLRQLALRNLDNLGVNHEAEFVGREMQRIFSTLTAAIPNGERSEERLRSSIRNALEEI